MIEDADGLLTSDVLWAASTCNPEQIFSPSKLVRWARKLDPGTIFSHWDLATWAEDNGYVSEDRAAPTADQVVQDCGSPSELLAFVKELDAEMGDWEFTRRLRDWAVSEMAKHEVSAPEIFAQNSGPMHRTA